MPARVNVYCCHTVAHLTAQALETELESVDWHLMAEWYDVEDEQVIASALSYFRIEGGNGNFTLHYRPPEKRPLEIRIISGQQAREWMDELIGELEYEDRPGYESIIKHLRSAVEIVELQTGFLDFVEMAPVFAYLTARWFMRIGEGYMRADDSEWWKLDGYSFVKLAPINANEQAPN